MATPLPPTVPSVLLPEILGFVPQFLLDDIIDTANDEVRQAVEAMEVCLQQWVTKRTSRVGDDWDSSQDIEQGLVAFQTLLYSHVDIAFDFFEAWSLRNIFAIPADLPIVAPHQRDLDLDRPPDEEAALLAEIDELRRKIKAQRKLQRLFAIAVRKSALQRARSENRLQRLAFLRSPQLQTLQSLPNDFLAMFNSVNTLPPHDESAGILVSRPLPEPGKRPWETSKTDYLGWAIDQLLSRTKSQGIGTVQGSSAVGTTVASAAEVASSSDLIAAQAIILAQDPSPTEDGMYLDA